MLVDPSSEDPSFNNVVAAMDKTRLSNDGKLQMYKDRRFGIDHDTGAQTSNAAIDKEDWDVSINKMRELCRDGGLVFFPARNTPGVEGGLIGQVPAGADIEPVDYESGDGLVTMKTLKLRRVREVHPDDGTGVFDEAKHGQYTVHSLNTHDDKIVDAYLELY